MGGVALTELVLARMKCAAARLILRLQASVFVPRYLGDRDLLLAPILQWTVPALLRSKNL